MRRILSLLLLFALIMSLCSCHGKLKTSDQGSPADYSAAMTEYALPSEFDESKSYEITFWAKADSNATQTAIYRRAISEFEALYPNVKINFKVYSDYGRLYQDVITNIPTNTTPDIAISYPDHVATYLTSENLVVPLDSLMIDEKYGLGGTDVRFDAPTASEIVPEFLEECRINNHYYGMPYMRSTEACYVNIDLLNKLGYELPETLTWDFIWEVCDKAMEQNPDGTYKLNGQRVLIPFIYKSTDNMMIQLLRQMGAEYSNESGDVLLFNDSAREVLDEVAEHAANRSFSTFKISSYPGNYLNRGQCIFAIDSTAGATWMGSDAPLIDVDPSELVQFDTAVRVIPQIDPESPKMISQGPSMCLLNSGDSGRVLASWLFMQYLLTDDIQLSYSSTEGYVPVTGKAQSSPEYLDYLSRAGEDNELYYKVKIEAARLLLENTENTFVTPVFNGSANVRNAAGQMIEEVAKSARRGDLTDGRYYDALFREMTTLYRLERELPEMPSGSIVLIAVLGVLDIGIVAYLVYEFIIKRRKSAKK